MPKERREPTFNVPENQLQETAFICFVPHLEGAAKYYPVFHPISLWTQALVVKKTEDRTEWQKPVV